MDPIIKALYWYFLKTEEDFGKRTVVLAFLFEAFGEKKAVDFINKYATDDTEIKIIAKHCKKGKNGKYNINWDAAMAELKKKGLTDYGK